jgi:hypothetical protein
LGVAVNANVLKFFCGPRGLRLGDELGNVVI